MIVLPAAAALQLIRAVYSRVAFVSGAYGRLRASVVLGTSGVLDAPLPVSVPGGTAYACHGNVPFGVAVITSLAAVGLRRRPAAEPPR